MQIFDGNYVDLLIFVVLIYFASEALRHGFWVIFSDFITFLISLFLALTFYSNVSLFLKVNFDLTISISNAIGFLFTAIIIESVLSFFAGYLVSKLPDKAKDHGVIRLLGIIPGLAEGLIFVSFLITLLVALPIKPSIKSDIVESKMGNFLLEKTTLVSSSIDEVFGGVINDSLTYFIVKPNSGESIDLEVDQLNLVIDQKAEEEMLNRVNQERKNLAIPELVLDTELVDVARDHAKDMWERRYFAHVSPDGKDVGIRLSEKNINYHYAGENLALAPTTLTAHTGLMNSKGHRENLLDEKFKTVGIGVIDNGYYGKMFVQVFTD